MRLPTVSQYKAQMSALSQQFDDVGRLQEMAATGKKLRRSSENPLLADKIEAVSSSMQRIKGYDLNMTLASSRAALQATATQTSINLVGQIKDLILSAQNDTLNNENRASIAQELKGLAQTLLGVANTQDNNGEYIFSGMNASLPPYVKDSNGFHYQGGAEATRIAIGQGNTVLYNDSGYRVFGDIKTGNGFFSTRSDTVNNTGTGVAGTVSQRNSSAMVADNYTLTFVTNAAGQLAYQITGANSGQVIPAPPQTSPADAPQFVAGEDMVFNGISLQITGQPEVGDVFEINQSKSQSVFDTLDAIIAVLGKPVNSEKDKADLHQELGEQGTSFNQVLNHLLEYFTEVGNRGKTIDDQKLMTKNTLHDHELLLQQLSEAPMESVLPELTQKLTAMELTQQSYLRIQETMHNLFKSIL